MMEGSLHPHLQVAEKVEQNVSYNIVYLYVSNSGTRLCWHCSRTWLVCCGVWKNCGL